MKRSENRTLTTHVGSLIRPPELLTFLKDKVDGKAIDEAAYAKILATSVQDVVRRQAGVGIDIINDGEFGKTVTWSRYVLERLTGFEQRDGRRGDMPRSIVGRERRQFADFYAEYDPTQNFVGLSGWAVTGPITYVGQAALQRDIADLKEATKDVKSEDVFMAAVAPCSVAPEREDRHYHSDEEYVFAVAEALRTEYRAIVDAGFILQIDDAFLPLMYDVLVPPMSLEEYRRWASIRIDALNYALKGIDQDRTRYHICWGSWNGPHVTDIALKEIVDIVLKATAGGYSVEMANPRHEHEWRLWETVKLPPGKVLVPGIVSHATNVVEHPELVAERIVRLAKLVGRENVIASTDCGFAQGPFTRRVHPSIMWAKLEALGEGAQLATRELWK